MAGRSVKLSSLFPDPQNGPDDARAFNDARRRLNSIHKTARTNSEEKGIETLFAAIGLATWNVESGTPPNAPVVLLPLHVEATGAAARDFTLKVEGDAHLNPVLTHILRAEHDIGTDDDEADVAEDPPSSYKGFMALLDRLRASWKALPELEIEPRVVTAIFSYSTMPLVSDLEQNGEVFATNEIVAAIAGDSGAREALASRICDPDPNQPDVDLPAQEFLVLDADSSQHMAINRVLGGESLVIQGPPGTGKSQTIANLITTLIARSLCQLLWKLPPGGLAHQAATASSALTGNSAKIPSSNFAPSTSKPIRFLPPFSGRQRSLSLSDTLNTRYNALSRRFIRRVASVLNLTALNTDSNGLVVRRCTQCSTGKS